MDWTQTGNIFPGQSGPGSNGNERLLYSLKNLHLIIRHILASTFLLGSIYTQQRFSLFFNATSFLQ